MDSIAVVRTKLDTFEQDLNHLAKLESIATSVEFIGRTNLFLAVGVIIVAIVAILKGTPFDITRDGIRSHATAEEVWEKKD